MRAVIIVLDSFGIGCLPDAAKYGDEGCNTLRSCVERGGARLPNMQRAGLFNIDGCGWAPGTEAPQARFARASEISAGKDTTTGHWELAGTVLSKPFPVFPDGFPEQLMRRLSEKTGRGILCNRPASGTRIINELGDEHVRTGNIIVYTSADSVLQIAAHTDVVPLNELYAICAAARELCVGEYAVGRVIARPFNGHSGHYVRTADRHDFSLEPGTTVFDLVKDDGMECVGIGKIGDIFAQKGLTRSLPSKGNQACTDSLCEVLRQEFDGLVMCNLVDFDMQYGHRRDCAGYAGALEAFDAGLPGILGLLRRDDMLIVTAAHGCDPAWRGTDHTREYIPVLCFGEGIEPGNAGTRAGFGCVGATAAKWLGVRYTLSGVSII